MEPKPTDARLSRRRFAAAGMAALGTLAASDRAAPGDAPADAPGTLAAAGRSAGIAVGSAIRSDPDPDLARIIASECTLVTPETALKPPRLAPSEGTFRWEEAERTFAFARAHGLSVHGHTLFWYRQPLHWALRASQGLDLQATVGIFGEVMETVMRRFPEAVSWDVFNEIAGTGRLLRSGAPIDRFGVDFLERILHRARAAAPEAALAINENALECRTCQDKRANVLALLAALKARAAPIDALGVQGHLSSRDRPDVAAVRDFLRRVEDLGLVVFLSEMDVNDARLAADDRQRDAEVATLYAEFLGPVLEVRAVRRVVFWGIADSANWIADGAAERRADGARQRPALFDRQLGRKPAYFAVRDALRSAPPR